MTSRGRGHSRRSLVQCRGNPADEPEPRRLLDGVSLYHVFRMCGNAGRRPPGSIMIRSVPDHIKFFQDLGAAFSGLLDPGRAHLFSGISEEIEDGLRDIVIQGHVHAVCHHRVIRDLDRVLHEFPVESVANRNRIHQRLLPPLQAMHRIRPCLRARRTGPSRSSVQ